VPTTASTKATALGVLHAFGYTVRIAYRDDEHHTHHFVITALGGCLADTPLGEVGLTHGGMLYPALNAEAERLGFGLAATGGAILLRFLVKISAALDGGDVLNSDWDFTADPASPIPAPPGSTPRTELTAWAG
jgi:hypothetical protein